MDPEATAAYPQHHILATAVRLKPLSNFMISPRTITTGATQASTVRDKLPNLDTSMTKFNFSSR